MTTMGNNNRSWMHHHLCGFVIVLAVFRIASQATAAVAEDLPMTTSFNVMNYLPHHHRKTLEGFSYVSWEESSQQENTPPPPSSSSEYPTSLELHTRSSVFGERLEEEADIRRLMAARMYRDQARVRWLRSRAIITGATAADDEREEEDEMMNSSEGSDDEMPITSGLSQGSGEYFALMTMGSPGSEYYLVADTGSDLTWLQCLPCSSSRSCYKQIQPIFNPGYSSTYSPLNCATQQCQWLEKDGHCGGGGSGNQCMYDYGYGDNSTTMGELAMESVAFSSSASSTHKKSLAIGCGHNNTGLFAGAAGILGLSPGPLSFPSQMKYSSFSYCLVDHFSNKSSTLEFGDSSTTQRSGDVVAAKLIHMAAGIPNIFYFVDLVGISVSGSNRVILISAYPTSGGRRGGAVIIDSGTVITRLHATVYGYLREDFLKAAANQLTNATDPLNLFDTCFYVQKSVQVPKVSFHFTDAKNKLELPADNYLISVDSDKKGGSTICLAFMPTLSRLTIIGNTQQQGMRVTYDTHNSRISFSPNQC